MTSASTPTPTRWRSPPCAASAPSSTWRPRGATGTARTSASAGGDSGRGRGSMFDMAGLAQLSVAVDGLAAVAFAVSGALVASRKELDIVGFMWLAVLTGVGGGTLRDLLLGVPVFWVVRSEEHTSELQSLMRISYAVFCLKKKK